MARRRKRGKRARSRPEGVASRSELRQSFKEAWRKCGHPKENRECWRHILKQAWGDV